jgi:hypothetical protein
MRWNTPDWWFGVLAGVLFGFWLALCFVEGLFTPSSDARSYIGIVGLVGYAIVVQVRSWRLRRQSPTTPTQA